MEFLNRRYIKRDVIEKRDYQVNLARQARDENCIVILPTGLGKTTVALQLIADCMDRGRGTALFLAPTRVLVNQHYEFLKEVMTIQDISLVTGESLPAKRAALWNNSVVCATPEITKNDLDRGMILPSQFDLVIFDEVHRTVGDYAYSGIAERLAGQGIRILGMTATLSSEREKTTEIMKMLRIASVANRDESSPDVAPYIQETHTDQTRVRLTGEMDTVRKMIRRALSRRCDTMRRNGLKIRERPSMSELLGIRQYVLGRDRRSAKPLFTAIRIMYALNMFEVHGVTTFLRFCERTSRKRGAGIKELLETDPDFTPAIRIARELQGRGVEHPKIPELERLVRKIPGKVLVFSSYRDSIDVIHRRLEELGIPAGILIGKAGEGGLKQKKQIEAVERFRAGEYKVLVATRVGEEGLDISEVNHVIFYDSVPSSIRYVQRRGRTGRKRSGNLTVMIAEDTVDEAYYWIGKRKISSMRKLGDKMAETAGTGGLDQYL